MLIKKIQIYCNCFLCFQEHDCFVIQSLVKKIYFHEKQTYFFVETEYFSFSRSNFLTYITIYAKKIMNVIPLYHSISKDSELHNTYYCA